MSSINNFLNSITMYRLVLYGLTLLALVGIVLGFLGLLPYNGVSLLLSALILLAACYVSNFIFAKILRVSVNVESVYITAFILFLIMPPPENLTMAWALILAGVIAMASKYLLAPMRKHIFNPAAFGAGAVFLLGLSGASWWIGSSVMFPTALIVGLLVVKKIRRFDLFLAFLVAAAASIIYFAGSADTYQVLKISLLSGPLIFFGIIMLTEPATTPPTRKFRILYGILIGALFNFYPTPEITLLLGNILSYAFGFKRKLILTLVEKNDVASGIKEFIFSPDKKFSFKPGQYLEWTLPHANPDTRGNRRYFTVASSPTEENIKLGVKLNKPSSSFKEKLQSMQVGEKATAGGLDGDFVLPRDKNKKLVFLAGGIGITPFRSIIKYLTDKGERRNITLFYSVKSEDEIAYRYLFIEAEAKVGLKTEYVVEKFLDESAVREKVPDWKERVFYISGPEAMVNAFKKMLLKMGVSRRNIVTDYFPGFA